MTDLNTQLDALRHEIDTEMRRVMGADGTTPDSFDGMIHYHMGWVDADFKQQVAKQGKRIRPILTLLCCQAAGGTYQQALPAAAAVEILHNFTLVHDDIQDASDTRRGRACNWTIWGAPQAINTGDAMFSQAQLAMTQLVERGVDPAIVVTCMRRLMETCIALTRGQWADMNFETHDSVTTAEYLAMIKGKTSVLIELACELGARIAGADEPTVQHYRQYGLDLGLAFQVIDDILGIWGDETVIGKSASSDITTKKKTLPVLFGLSESAGLRAHYQLAADSPNFVPRTVTLLEEAGARQFAENHAEQHSASAVHHLNAAAPTGEAAHALHALTNWLLQRDA